MFGKFENEVFIRGDGYTRESLSVDLQSGLVQVFSHDKYGDTTVVNLSVEQAERLIAETRNIIDKIKEGSK